MTFTGQSESADQQARDENQKLIFFFFLVVVLGFELRALILSHSISLFFFLVIGFFEIGSHKLFIQAGFELQSS
jgi:hypothetical protein